jgi:hypothetical protein
MRASRTPSGFDRAFSIKSQVIADSGIFARLDQHE